MRTRSVAPHATRTLRSSATPFYRCTPPRCLCHHHHAISFAFSWIFPTSWLVRVAILRWLFQLIAFTFYYVPLPHAHARLFTFAFLRFTFSVTLAFCTFSCITHARAFSSFCLHARTVHHRFVLPTTALRYTPIPAHSTDYVRSHWICRLPTIPPTILFILPACCYRGCHVRSLAFWIGYVLPRYYCVLPDFPIYCTHYVPHRTTHLVPFATYTTLPHARIPGLFSLRFCLLRIRCYQLLFFCQFTRCMLD